MEIITDCDGCLLDWQSGFNDWASGRGFKIVDPFAYAIKDMFGIDEQEEGELIRGFNASKESGELHPLRDAALVLPWLKDAGHVFHIVTAFGTAKHLTQRRLTNLAQIFGPIFSSVLYVNPGESKKLQLEWLGPSPDKIWVEDHVTHARTGAELGFNSILIAHPYNEAHADEFKRVNSWGELAEML